MNAALLNELLTRDNDAYMAVLAAPKPAQDFLLALFSLRAELNSIPAKVTQPTIGLVRIVWWRDRLEAGETKAHPILEALASFPNQSGRLAAYAETFGEVFDETDQKQARAELLASLCHDFLSQAPLPCLYRVALAIDDPAQAAGLKTVKMTRSQRRAAAPLLFLALAGTRKTALGRAKLALRLSFGW